MSQFTSQAPDSHPAPRTKGQTYWEIFRSSFYISAFTFGGGYVIVPLLQERFVKELHFLTDEEVLNLTAIGQSAPGPVAINTALLLGLHVAGLPGAFLAIFGTVLPPFLILSVISLAYEAFAANPYIQAFLMGMRSGVAALICQVTVTMAGRFVKAKNAFAMVIMALGFAAIYFGKMNPALVILGAGLAGLLAGFVGRKRGRGTTGAPQANAPKTNAPQANALQTNAPQTNAPQTKEGDRP